MDFTDDGGGEEEGEDLSYVTNESGYIPKRLNVWETILY